MWSAGRVALPKGRWASWSCSPLRYRNCYASRKDRNDAAKDERRFRGLHPGAALRALLEVLDGNCIANCSSSRGFPHRRWGGAMRTRACGGRWRQSRSSDGDATAPIVKRLGTIRLAGTQPSPDRLPSPPAFRNPLYAPLSGVRPGARPGHRPYRPLPAFRGEWGSRGAGFRAFCNSWIYRDICQRGRVISNCLPRIHYKHNPAKRQSYDWNVTWRLNRFFAALTSINFPP